MTVRAAGALLVARTGKALFLRRADTGLWAFPGGHIEEGETAEQAAERELGEEIGPALYDALKPWTRRIKDDGQGDVDFTTFAGRVNDEFIPTLNEEHTAWTWADIADPPQPLHPGAAIALAKFGLDELGIARAMAAGELVSPQKYGTFYLWKIRITGTGVAWRGAERDDAGKIVREEEFCWRDPSIYLEPDFLARCNGLPVTFIHSEGKTDSIEWDRRAVGTVFLPFIEAEDVWAIAKVYDDDANDVLLSGPFSTSPAVFFDATKVGEKFRLENGAVILVESRPTLLDSISLVPQGVWDKAGPPVGVRNDQLIAESSTSKEPVMAEEDKAAAEQARKDAVAKLDALLDAVSKMDARLDAMEEGDRKREEGRKDRARMDAARKDRFGARKDGESYKDYKARHDADEMAMCDAMRADGCDEAKAREDAARARKDAEEAERKDGGESFEKWAKEEENEPEHKDDKARKDAEELERKAEEEKRDMERKDAASAQKIADLEQKLADMTRMVTGLTKETSADERNALALAQSRADGIAGLFGERASQPMLGESARDYRRRLAASFKQHSAKFKDSRFDGMDDNTFAAVEEIVYADAANAARSPARATAGMLIPIEHTDPAGRRITTYTGDPMAWMQHFMSGAQIGKIVRPQTRV